MELTRVAIYYTGRSAVPFVAGAARGNSWVAARTPTPPSKELRILRITMQTAANLTVSVQAR